MHLFQAVNYEAIQRLFRFAHRTIFVGDCDLFPVLTAYSRPTVDFDYDLSSEVLYSETEAISISHVWTNHLTFLSDSA
jgi:hypothetical protein